MAKVDKRWAVRKPMLLSAALLLLPGIAHAQVATSSRASVAEEEDFFSIGLAIGGELVGPRVFGFGTELRERTAYGGNIQFGAILGDREWFVDTSLGTSGLSRRAVLGVPAEADLGLRLRLGGRQDVDEREDGLGLLVGVAFGFDFDGYRLLSRPECRGCENIADARIINRVHTASLAPSVLWREPLAQSSFIRLSLEVEGVLWLGYQLKQILFEARGETTPEAVALFEAERARKDQGFVAGLQIRIGIRVDVGRLEPTGPKVLEN